MWRSSSQASEQKKCMSEDSYDVRLVRKSHPALVPKAISESERKADRLAKASAPSGAG